MIDECYDLNVAFCMFTRRVVIQRRVEHLQLGDECYQKKLNLTKPDTFRQDLRKRTAYTAYSDPQGVIYIDQNNRYRLMCTDELHKFSDGTLDSIQTALHDITSRIRMEYLPKKKWSRLDKKSTGGICTFVGCCLTSWFSKKQTALAISTTEAEYVSIEKACQQALWMKQDLVDYDVRLDDVLIMYDNKVAVNLSKIPVQHTRTKYMKICHHFLHDNVQKGHISIEKCRPSTTSSTFLLNPLNVNRLTIYVLVWE
nr:retrovirus-related Pol polyprotein from transposon TNT 1-94 [Tanacetum cinerariifolium]